MRKNRFHAQRSAIDLLSSDEDEEGEEEAEVLPSETGLASWYGPGFHKRRTASGERFDMHAMTAAHRTLPFGTMVCVRSQITGRGVVVRINDRGPHAANRVVDLSRGAAIALGLHGLGLKPVDVFPLSAGEDYLPAQATRLGRCRHFLNCPIPACRWRACLAPATPPFGAGLPSVRA